MMRQEMTKKDHAIMEICMMSGNIRDLMDDPDFTDQEKKEIMYEIGWLVGELCAYGGAMADELGEDFRDYIH